MARAKRNDICPCGKTGLKYKKCCWLDDYKHDQLHYYKIYGNKKRQSFVESLKEALLKKEEDK